MNAMPGLGDDLRCAKCWPGICRCRASGVKMASPDELRAAVAAVTPPPEPEAWELPPVDLNPVQWEGKAGFAELCDAASADFFQRSGGWLPKMDPPGMPPCPICGYDLEMADLDDGTLGWLCGVCNVGWHAGGCHPMKQESQYDDELPDSPNPT